MRDSLPRLAKPLALGLAAAFSAGEALAQDRFSASFEAIYDMSRIDAQAGSATDHAAKFQLALDADLEALAGWRGAFAHASVEALTGDQPNVLAGSIQGINNIEASHRVRLYQAWIEQDFAAGRGSALMGLYDFNSEFYVTEASGLLIAPAFGIGSETALSGPGGPPLFPSTSLSLRLAWTPAQDVYLYAAAMNAALGVPGDPGGVDTSFDSGLMLAAEGGWTGDGKLAAGAWTYSEKLDDLVATGPLGGPAEARAWGIYVLAERRLDRGGDTDRAYTGFLRAGISDGDTGPLSGAWQAGLLVERVRPSRPDSAFSVGVNQARLGDKHRLAASLPGQPLAEHETQVEITYADRLGERLIVQPDLMWVRNPGGLANVEDAWIATLRLSAAFGAP